MQIKITSMSKDDDLSVETKRDEITAKRKAIKMGGWQIGGRGAFIFNTDAEMGAFSAWLVDDQSQRSDKRRCHYCGMPSTGYGPFGEPACGECGGRN